MSYHEKRAIVDIFSSILITVVYSAYLFQRYLASGSEILADTRFWGWAFLALILVSIIANIVIGIMFRIVYRITEREEEPSFTDERDQLIELKGARNALYVFSIGVVISMITLVVGLPLYAMFITLTYSGLASSVLADITQFSLYRRGF
jgi:hypothetical protein